MKGLLLAAFVALLTAGCASGAIVDPKAAADAYAAAAAAGDADAIYGMMTSAGRKERSRDDVRRLVQDERGELVDEAHLLRATNVRIEATARMRFGDGEETALDLREGRFWVTSAGTLPGGARSPEGALDDLRRALARRSYAALMRVVTPSTRAAMELDLRALVTGLEHPEGLDVQVLGDQARISLPEGHHVSLKRDAGIWRVDDFD